MKTTVVRVGILVLTAFALVGGSADAAQLSLEKGFRNPPNEAKPHLWWHWMNGNVTREGITADLESMAAVGYEVDKLSERNISATSEGANS